MKSSLGDKQRIQHIREAIDHIENFTTGISYEDYVANLQLRLALVKLKAVRNILVHEYFGIDYAIYLGINST